MQHEYDGGGDVRVEGPPLDKQAEARLAERVRQRLERFGGELRDDRPKPRTRPKPRPRKGGK